MASIDIFDKVKDIILSNKKDKITEEILVQKLGVSRTPIRESLKELEVKGIINRKKNGIFLHKPSAKEIADLFDMRIIMESHAARLAAQNNNEKQNKQLKKLATSSEKYTGRGQYSKAEKETKKFHQHIIEMAGNILLERIWTNFLIWERVVNIYHTEVVKNPQTGKNPYTHTEISRLIEKGDEKGAEELMNKHLKWARKKILEKITGIIF